MSRANTQSSMDKKSVKKTVKLNTWEEVAAYKAEHLKPAGYTPKEQPIYNFEEVKSLNIEFIEDDE